ncbi:MAG TPA: HAD-IB family phosphatase [Acidimicrobiales bacterium]
MISEALAGKRIAVTGGTGFLGTALVERLLRCVPGCEVVLIVRPGRRGADDRVRREILRNDCFDRLRAELRDGRGGPAADPDPWDAMIASRLRVIAGDVSTDGLGLDEDGRSALAACDVVIHSAAAVSFDSPLDTAVEVNLLGPTRVAETLRAIGSRAHLVAVSTAYVAGTRRGPSPEALLPDTPFSTEVDWKAEVAAARRLRSDLDARSRSVDMLARFAKLARREVGAAGSPVLAEKTERLREEWVKDELVEAGRARARALGWPDAYAYTKALGERALLERRGDVPLTIVRPSIIESALAEPEPGWIRGFRMAEPVIISYARGLLKEFPGLPEGVVDVIPVDLVVAALVAVAAAGPDPAGPTVYQAASGSRNPLRYRQLVDLVRAYFLEHPLYDTEGQPIVVPEWTFPGRGRVQQQLQRASTALARGERVLASLPVRGRRAELGARLEERRAQADRALSYVELYGAYAECEAIYGVDHLLALAATTAGNVADDGWAIDPAVIDWPSYVHDIHLPSVVEHARVKTSGGRREGPSRRERGLKTVLSPDRQLAVFDLENTLIASNVVESWAWLATRHLPTGDRVRFTMAAVREAPALLALDRRDRGDFLRHFYRRYEDAPVARLQGDAEELFASQLLMKCFPSGIRRVREHRALGHRTMLITGALDVVVGPLRPLFDEVVCASLSVREDGRFTGELDAGPPTGEARALLMMDYCAAEGLSMEQTVAYADSSSDLPMLEAAGVPVAVNAEPKLAAIARKRGWHTEHWSKAPGAPTRLLPIGPLLHPATRGTRSGTEPATRP